MKTKTLYIKEVKSTNDFLMSYEPEEGEEMTVVWTDFQTAGRGQGTNHWESEVGKNLTFSVLTHPVEIPATQQYVLSMAIALAVKEALDAYIGDVTVKWPNDIYWKDYKISGTLIETSLKGALIRNCIFGTGINVNQQVFRSDAPNPVSLHQILHHEVDREEVMQRVTDALQRNLERLRREGTAALHDDYKRALYRKEGMHRYEDAEGVFEASIEDVLLDGHLILRKKDGRLCTYAFKEVKFIIDKE